MAIIGTSKYVLGTPIVWAGSDYAPTLGQPAKTAGLDLTFLNLPAAGAAQQGVKHGIGSLSLDISYLVRLWCEFQVTAPSDGRTVDVYFGWSDNAGSGVNNPGGLSGVDSRYYGYGSTLDEGLDGVRMLQPGGSLTCSPHIAVQVQDIGIISPKGTYVMPVIVNDSGQPIAATNGVETALALIPRILQTEN